MRSKCKRVDEEELRTTKMWMKIRTIPIEIYDEEATQQEPAYDAEKKTSWRSDETCPKAIKRVSAQSKYLCFELSLPALRNFDRGARAL